MPARLRYDSDSRRLGEMFLKAGVYLLTDLLETDVSSIVAREASSYVEQLQAESKFFCLSEHRSAHGDRLAECVRLQASTADMETEIYNFALQFTFYKNIQNISSFLSVYQGRMQS